MSKSIKKSLKERFSNSAKLIRAAWRVLKDDKKLITISLINYISGFIILSVILIVAFVLIFILPSLNNEIIDTVVLNMWLILIVAPFLISYFFMNYFNCAMAHTALRRFDGEKITMKQAFSAASKKSPAIFLFSCVQATLGLILGILEEYIPLAAKIAVWLTGAAWNIAGMFSVPVIMTSDEKNPIKVVKKSAATFKSIWQESVFVGFGLGIISLLSGLVFLILISAIIYAAIALNSSTIGLVGGIFIVITASLYTLVISTFKTILITAAYYYASTNKLPAGFDEELIRNMFRPNKKWLA